MYKRQFLRRYELNARQVQRKNVYVVYLKESEQIISMLGMMGAHEALLRMESARVVKAVRNRVNRETNCDSANMDKAINAAMRQVETIEWLEENMGLNRLTPALEQVARARLEDVYKRQYRSRGTVRNDHRRGRTDVQRVPAHIRAHIAPTGF